MPPTTSCRRTSSLRGTGNSAACERRRHTDLHERERPGGHPDHPRVDGYHRHASHGSSEPCLLDRQERVQFHDHHPVEVELYLAHGLRRLYEQPSGLLLHRHWEPYNHLDRRWRRLGVLQHPQVATAATKEKGLLSRPSFTSETSSMGTRLRVLGGSRVGVLAFSGSRKCRTSAASPAEPRGSFATRVSPW
jgi:hypothetical protein